MPPSSPTQTGGPATPAAIAAREPTKTVPKESPLVQTNGPDGQSPPPRPGHQRLVFTDPVAFRYLEEDPATIVLHRRMTLDGYEVYIVEQWACTRIHPTFIITTYTGDPSHKVAVGVLSVPTDESTWSPRLRLYFNAVVQCQAQKRDTPLGTLMVTDLSIFPCALALIPVPDGDVLKHKDDFIVNENLKRLGCSGRASLKLQPPSPATEAKFHQLYRTSERVPLYSAVVELVKQCQIALMMFGNLAPEYVDGLLCDMTEAAIADWWTEIGMDLYNIEPSDSMLGPISVSALLGTLIGARNRLHAFGAPVGKDAFDIPNLKRGIGSFQKSQKIKRTRRLDRQTLDRLHRVTAKAANAEGWTDAVKSTVAELSGHGGEMVMGMVRGREKGGIADIETLDIDTFARLVKGERAKWLWRGKPRKGAIGESKPSESAAIFDEKDQNLSSIVRRGVSGKVSDARAGFGRFKDAVGLRSHPSKHSREGQYDYGDSSHLPPIDSDTEPSQPKKPDGDPNTAEQGSIHESEGRALKEDAAAAESAPSIVPPQSPEAKTPAITVEAVPDTADSESAHKVPVFQPASEEEVPDEESRRRTPSTDVSADRERTPDIGIMLLRRPRSCAQLPGSEERSMPERTDGHWPRHLSFSTVEEVVLGWDEIGGNIQERPDATLEEAILHEDVLASDARLFSGQIRELSEQTAPWVEQQVTSVDDLSRCLHESYEKINAAYLERLAVFQQLRGKSTDLLSEEHTHLTDYMRRVELMGAKLDYELHVLESKVEDVEAGLGEFERHVADVETRVRLLVRGEKEKDRESSSSSSSNGGSWLSWLGKLVGV
ncbi:hypothetical protein ASPACDRAFT_26855 [Aspergillus aculeatus ATCC 16872]|uniref:STB6-like N-terminal domain-containing protein n=1 Tax=Aspergillus aculeatus (strain ATCC 16872 / CBS 172.66 / WB 5094) TaxID=690307 RepID=A0A1L9WXK3_ASPA1|nr:uncharacterized protein ASPACDRAFT_26855 [Aspergillus aculeatus ATCC 16872]OJK00982.1 hypothetical protein ASPACDRAFT_26855 [Aspergillus aculeatus ATCC 16872]